MRALFWRGTRNFLLKKPEPNQLGGITHVCCNLYLKTNKNAMFFFFSFLFCKIGEQEGEQVQPGVAPVGGGRWWGKEVGG
jgi:hypothetical protein